MRNGDFSRLTDAQGRPIIIYDPLTTDANGNRQPFPGNIIPPNRINPVGRAMVNALPLPDDRTSTTATSTTSPQDIIKSKAHQGSLKIDHHFNDTISLSGVYLYQNSVGAGRQLLPGRAVRRAELSARSRRSTCSCSTTPTSSTRRRWRRSASA